MEGSGNLVLTLAQTDGFRSQTMCLGQVINYSKHIRTIMFAISASLYLHTFAHIHYIQSLTDINL